MQENIDTIPFFFIIGRARSGTTLLRCLMDAHPEINIPLECAFIIHLYPKYGKITDWTEPLLISFFDDVLRYPKFHFWVMDNEQLKNDLLHCAGRNTYSHICKVVYLSFKSFFQKSEIKLLGDKNPSYSFQIKKLLKLFPDARFIHITRDYRDNVISIINAKFETPIYSSLAYRWKYYNKQIIKQKKLRPDRFYTLRYEDLVRDHENYLKEMCRFLGIGFSAEMLNYRAKLNEMLTTYPAELINLHHKNLLKPINNENLYAWKQIMTPRQVKICDTVVGSFAEENGYERVNKKCNLFLYIGCLPGILYGYMLYVFMNVIHKMPIGVQMKIINLLAVIFHHDWKKFRKNEPVQE